MCAYIPARIRPTIHVKLLPFLEDWIFRRVVGFLLSSILMLAIGRLCLQKIPHWELCLLVPTALIGLDWIANIEPNAFMDGFLFLPYGVLHYISPLLFSFYALYYGYYSLTRNYLHALGFMNLFGVITQILLPCAPPWYNNKYGIAAADYSMPGDPAGLINVDKLLGTHMFENMFTSSPLVFGAMPSLHSAMAVIVMLFGFKLGNKIGYCLAFYVLWIWTATIYFDHHYMVDLYFGMIYAAVAFKLFYLETSVDLLPLYNLVQTSSPHFE